MAFDDGDKEYLGVFGGGFRNLNNISPDGGIDDTGFHVHKWIPIPLKRSGKVKIIVHKKSTNAGWISGIAFNKNKWNWAMNPIKVYEHNLNLG